MSIEFEEEVAIHNRSVSASGSGISRWLIDKNIVKNEKQVEILLLGICIICALLTVFIFIKYVFISPSGSPSPQNSNTLSPLQEKIKSMRNTQQ